MLFSVYRKGVFDFEASSLLSTAGLVYISYIGITKVVSLSEEISDPERNIPKGIFWALGTVVLIYILGTIIMVGVIPMDKLSGNLTPVASAAEIFSNKVGVILVSFAAILAFVSVANAGIMGASRYPFAMGRDKIIPEVFKKLSKQGVPNLSILFTVGIILVIIISFDITKIAKLASTFQLLLFALLCFSLIIMRESKIESYDPSHFSPLYPWMQILGIISSFLIIIAMGVITMSLSVALIIIGSFWYFFYVKGKVSRTGAIYNVFERLGRSKDSKIEYIFRDQDMKRDQRNLESFDEM